MRSAPPPHRTTAAEWPDRWASIAQVLHFLEHGTFARTAEPGVGRPLPSRAMLHDFIDEYRRYRAIGERALAQIPDAALDHVTAPDGNSPAMLVRHLSGNLASRFTDFLVSDGEKPWRDREQEFAERAYGRVEMDALWLADRKGT